MGARFSKRPGNRLRERGLDSTRGRKQVRPLVAVVRSSPGGRRSPEPGAGDSTAGDQSEVFSVFPYFTLQP